MAWPRLILAVAAVAVVAGCVGSADLCVDSRPEGAEIYVDGFRWRDVTPARVFLRTGQREHTIVVKMAGYVNSKAIVLTGSGSDDPPARKEWLDDLQGPCFCLPSPCSCWESITKVGSWEGCSSGPLGFPLQPNGQGLIVYLEEEKGFSVFVNGELMQGLEQIADWEYREHLYLVVPIPEPGAQVVEVRKEGYEDWKETVQVEKDCYLLLSPDPEPKK